MIYNKTKKRLSALDNQLYFNINQVSQKLDVVPATIRNWEKSGLFVAKRKGNNYRVYDFNDIEYLKKIKTYSIDEGMNMELIKKILSKDTIISTLSDKKFLKEVYHSKLKKYREQNNYTLEYVSNSINISPSYLSRIEQGLENVSLTILEKLANFYGESTLTFFNIDEASSEGTVKAGEGTFLETSLKGTEIRLLTNHSMPFSPVHFTVASGCGDLKAHSHFSGNEFIYVLSGKLQVELDYTETYILKEGDSISFKSTRMHSWHNCGKNTLQILWVHSPL